ncbi:MAG: hypothetical protein ABDH32_05425 [Candidatus Caldarchaeales archaeon]
MRLDVWDSVLGRLEGRSKEKYRCISMSERADRLSPVSKPLMEKIKRYDEESVYSTRR